MKFYRMCIILLMLMGTYLQADVTKEPVCRSIVECDKLVHSIEVQIDELKAKGTLTKDEKRLRCNLQKQLLAAMDSIIAVQKAKQIEIRKTNKKLNELGTLLK